MPKRPVTESGSSGSIAPIFQVKKSKKQESSDSLEREDDAERQWRILSWNVAGLRGMAKKQNHKPLIVQDADLVFLGEIKCKEWPTELEADFKKYHKTLAISTEKNGGYAGVALLSKIKPIKVWTGIDDAEFDKQGRIIFAEFSRFYFVGAYVPNSGRGLVNLGKREKWEQIFLKQIKDLDSKKPVVYGGDLNVAHNEIDLANPVSNRNKTAGFTDQERGWFGSLLDAGFKDTFRTLHADRQEYTFWSYMGNARSRNVGWRLDYYIVSSRIMENVNKSEILTDVMGSDHAPIVLEIRI